MDKGMARRLGVASAILRRDRELYDLSHAHLGLTVEQIREWCENGELATKFPSLPELFSAMSDAEIKEWCEGGEQVEGYLIENADLPDSYWGLPEDEVQELREHGGEHGEYHRGPIPSLELPLDPGLKLRQLRAMLGDEISPTPGGAGSSTGTPSLWTAAGSRTAPGRACGVENRAAEEQEVRRSAEHLPPSPPAVPFSEQRGCPALGR